MALLWCKNEADADPYRTGNWGASMTLDSWGQARSNATPHVLLQAAQSYNNTQHPFNIDCIASMYFNAFFTQSI